VVFFSGKLVQYQAPSSYGAKAGQTNIESMALYLIIWVDNASLLEAETPAECQYIADNLPALPVFAAQ